MKSDRRGLLLDSRGYVIPRLADSRDSTAGFIVVAVMASRKVLDLKCSSSHVTRKFKSPQNMSKVEGVILDAPPSVSSVRKCLERSDWRFLSSASFPGESKWALPTRIYKLFDFDVEGTMHLSSFAISMTKANRPILELENLFTHPHMFPAQTFRTRKIFPYQLGTISHRWFSSV